MGVRVEFRWPDGLVARVDEARGLASRAAWVRWAVEQALEAEEPSELVRMMQEREKPNTVAEADAAIRKAYQPLRDEASRPLSRAEAFRRATQK